MEVLVMPAVLEHWDERLRKSQEVDSLALSFWNNERPLRGVAGLVDWRLHGRLSRLIITGDCIGDEEDCLMMPAGERLPFFRVFLFGLGAERRMTDADYLGHCRRIRAVVNRAGSTRYALQAPGRATERIPARRAAQLWRDDASDSHDQVTFIDSVPACREIHEVFSR